MAGERPPGIGPVALGDRAEYRKIALAQILVKGSCDEKMMLREQAVRFVMLRLRWIYHGPFAPYCLSNEARRLRQRSRERLVRERRWR